MYLVDQMTHNGLKVISLRTFPFLDVAYIDHIIISMLAVYGPKELINRSIYDQFVGAAEI